MKGGWNLGNSLLSHYAAGNAGAGKTQGNPGRAAARPGPAPGPDIGTDRSYYGSHRDRQLLRGGYDRTAVRGCSAGQSVVPGAPSAHRAGWAPGRREGMDGTAVKAGA